MSVSIDSYKPQYKTGVAACLRRNYPWMEEESQESIARWLEPVLHYTWTEDLSENDFPHKYGTVILAEDRVVGFLGAVYSRRYSGDEPYIFLRPTTWAIDDKYRIYLFKALKVQFAAADVIGDFEPRDSVEETLVKLYHFQYIDHKMYKFPAIPYLLFSQVDITFFQEAAEINDEHIKVEYMDNQPYGVGCVCVRPHRREGKCYIFYQLIGKAGRRRILIMKVSQPRIFAEFTHEILWKMQHFTKAYNKVKCDSRFFGGQPVRYPFRKSKKVARLLLNKLPEEVVPQTDFLYSDTCMLEG